jgi:hypothetical protein
MRRKKSIFKRLELAVEEENIFFLTGQKSILKQSENFWKKL